MVCKHIQTVICNQKVVDEQRLKNSIFIELLSFKFHLDLANSYTTPNKCFGFLLPLTTLICLIPAANYQLVHIL